MTPSEKLHKFLEKNGFSIQSESAIWVFNGAELSGLYSPSPPRSTDLTFHVPATSREMGMKGGRIGGKNRARSLSPFRRSEIAQKAAQARWSKKVVLNNPSN